MEVFTDLKASFKSDPIERIDQQHLRWLTPRKFGPITKAIDEIGIRSATSQNLKRPVTSYDRLCDSGDDHALYLYWSQETPTKALIHGYLKTGKRQLYLRDSDDDQFILSPLCMLDFFVVDDDQHHGIGKALFDAMLENEGITAGKVAYDKPNDKLLGFLEKHYGLKAPIWQNTSYAVFPEFFSDLKPHNTVDKGEAPSTKNHKHPNKPFESLVSSPRLPFRQRDVAGGIIHGTAPLPERKDAGAETPRGRKNTRDFGHSNIFG